MINMLLAVLGAGAIFCAGVMFAERCNKRMRRGENQAYREGIQTGIKQCMAAINVEAGLQEGRSICTRGLGTFREAEPVASYMHGGAREQPDQCNYFDAEAFTRTLHHEGKAKAYLKGGKA